MATPILFPTLSANQSPARAAVGRMVNCVMEMMPDGQVNRRRAPGISLFTANVSLANHCRGMISPDASNVVVVYNGNVELVTSTGISSILGTLIGSDIVTLAVNNNLTPQIACVTAIGPYQLFTGSAPIAYPDANVGIPNSVCFGDGYFFFTYGNNTVQASAINAITINPLDAIKVNSSSSELIRGVYFAQTLFLFTGATIEAWTDTANPTGFPFSRTAIIPRGLINYTAIAGFEAGYASFLMWVGSDNIIYSMNGYAPTRVSNSAIETRLQSLADPTTLRACVYMCQGHAYWQITCTDFTYVYDVTNSVWHERNSDGQNFSRIEIGYYAFGKWLVGDHSSNVVGYINPAVFSEYGATLTYSITSLPGDTFPTRFTVGRADFNFIAGTAISPYDGETYPADLPPEDPVVMISWSKDGGASFSRPVQRSLGTTGAFNQCVTVLNTGMTTRFGRVWKLEVSDPVYVGLIGGTMA